MSDPAARGALGFAFDVTPWLASRTGVGVAVGELALSLAATLRAAEGDRMRLCALSARRDAARRLHDSFPGASIRLRRLPVRVVAPLADRGLTCEALFGRAELYHTGALVVPRARHGAVVATVFDLTPIRYPEMHLPSNRFTRAELERRLARADLVVAPSRQTARDLTDLAGVAASKVRVVPLGVREVFFEPPGPRAALAGLGLDCDYVLAVGSVEPRKNLRRLFEAFGIARRRHRLPHRLAVVGPEGWKEESLGSSARGLGIEDALAFTGWVDDAALRTLYGNAALLVYPSLYEGFGFPPLEAMAAGCPVASSRSSSLPEIVGDAALLFDPSDTEEMAEAIGRMIGSSDLRRRAIEAGRARARAYSWRRAAEATRAVYREAIAQRSESKGSIAR